MRHRSPLAMLARLTSVRDFHMKLATADPEMRRNLAEDCWTAAGFVRMRLLARVTLLEP